jgi:RNA polymerase sigma-70 factor (ECF subfamily)
MACPCADAVHVAAAQAGDVGAVDVLVRRHRERIFGVLYHVTGNREDAADLAQDTFILAFRSIRKFRGASQFYTWLYRIAVNLALRHLRRRRVRQFFSFERLELDGASEEFAEALATKLSANKSLLLKELRREISEALAGLSPRHRMVVVLAEIEGLSTEEIAEAMGCAAGTVRSRLHYAKGYLKSALRRYLED